MPWKHWIHCNFDNAACDDSQLGDFLRTYNRNSSRTAETRTLWSEIDQFTLSPTVYLFFVCESNDPLGLLLFFLQTAH